MNEKNVMNPIPIEWIERIFSRLRVVYGPAMMGGVWGSDLSEVIPAWAEELKYFKDHPGAIKYALEHLPSDYPPNLLQFKEICREGLKFEPKPIGLEHKLSPEEIEAGRKKAKEMIENLARNKRAS